MTSAHAAQVTGAWDASTDPGVTGYRVHYGTVPGSYTSHVDMGNVNSCVVSGLLDGVTYYFAATAYDGDGNESDYSTAVNYTVPQAPAPVPEPTTAAPASGDGGCFIATAAFGSYHAPEVVLLQKFRDRILLASEPGRLFVELYYRVSPPIAAFISRDDSLRRATRLSLKPLIFSIQHRLGLYVGVLALLMGLTCVLYLQQKRLVREVRNIRWGK